MGIITRIEEGIGGLIEKPFRHGQSLDLIQVEIVLKRFIEKNKKTILDKVYVHYSYTIVLNNDLFTENEPFIHHYIKLLKSHLVQWLWEKKYELNHPLSIHILKGDLQDGLFKIRIAFDPQFQPQHGLLELRSGSIFLLHKPVTIIGRGEDCHICLTDDTVSKRHAQITTEKDFCILTDLCSSNGTRVNQGKVSTILLHGSEKIFFGSAACVYMSNLHT